MKQDYKIWANDFHPVALKSDRWVRQKIDYIHYNPVRKGFVELPEHWKYSSARNWILGDDRIIKIDRDSLWPEGKAPGAIVKSDRAGLQ